MLFPIIFRTTGHVLAGYPLDVPIILGYSGRIVHAMLFCEATGTGGDPLVVDIRKSGVSIFSDVVKRPRLLANTGANKRDKTPVCDFAIRDFSSINWISAHVLSAPTGCQNVSLMIWAEAIIANTQGIGYPMYFKCTQPVPGTLLDAPICPGIDGHIMSIIASTDNAGTMGATQTVIDVLKNGVSLFADAANKPRIISGPGNDYDITPDTDLISSAISQNDWIVPVCESVPAGLGAVNVVIWIQ